MDMPKIQFTTLFGLFFIFTFWKTKPRKASPLFIFCCLKKSRNRESYEKEEITLRTSVNALSLKSTGEFPKCSTIGVKRNCVLPPVPIAGRSSQVLDGEWIVPHKPKSPLPQPISVPPPLSTVIGWFNPSIVCSEEGRPYSYCGPPGSESDPLYASVGGGGGGDGGGGGGGGNPHNLEHSQFLLLRRQRANSDVDGVDQPQTVKRVNVAGHHHHQVGSTWAQVYALPGTIKCDSETGEDSYSGSVVPYYSSIAHDGATGENRSKSPFYQDEPVLRTSHQADVYAQVQSNGPDVYSSTIGQNIAYRKSEPVHLGPSIAGPPVPMRSYNPSEVEELLNQRRPLSFGDSSNKNNLRPISGTSLSVVDKRHMHLLDRIQAGFRRRSNGLRISQSSSHSVSTQASMSPGNNINDAIRQHQDPFSNRTHDEEEEQNLSAGSDKYRTITVRESIASLRARNALPAFLTDPRFRPSSNQVSNDAEYEGVYYYPDDQRDSANPYESDSTHHRDRVDSSSAAGRIQDPASDPYTEITNVPPLRNINRRSLMNGSSVKPRKTPLPTESDLDVNEIYAMPSSSEAAGRSFALQVVDEQQQQHPNMVRILLEMQAFRYVDSETDLSRSITPSSLNRDIKMSGSNRSLDAISSNPPASCVPSNAVQSGLPLMVPPLRSFSPIIHHKPIEVISHNTTMTPLMERSMEESTATTATSQAAHSADPSIWSQEGEPSGASSLHSSVGAAGHTHHLTIDAEGDDDDVGEFDQIALWPAYENWGVVLGCKSPLPLKHNHV